MRAVSAGFLQEIDEEVTHLTFCIEIERRDTVTYRFTTHDMDVPFEGNTFRASGGFATSAQEFRISMAVANLEFAGFLDDLRISERDLIARRFDRAKIKIWVVNWLTPTDGGMRTIRGWFGNVVRNGESFAVEGRSLMQGLQQTIGSVISDRCRATFGDTGNGADRGCNYPINPTTWTALTEYGDQPVGTGARMSARPNGGGDWDGGVHVNILSAGTGYSDDVEIIAYATFDDGTPFVWEAISVTITNGSVVAVEFPPTDEGRKPGHTEITFSIIDVGFTNTNVSPTIPNGFHYKLIDPGTSGATEPTWNTSLGGQTTDGDAIWETVQASYYTATVEYVEGRNYLEGTFQSPVDLTAETAVLGSGASLAALANGAGNWDGGDTSDNVDIVSGGLNYVNPVITARFTNPLTSVEEEFVAIQVGLSSTGAITYVQFDPTVENEKPDVSEVSFEIVDDGGIDAESEAGFFDSGTLTFLDGENIGIEIDIQAFTDEGSGYFTATLYAPAPFDIGVGVSDGTTVMLRIGCDKRKQTCQNRFNNFLNFRGEPDIPGTDVLFRINTNL